MCIISHWYRIDRDCAKQAAVHGGTAIGIVNIMLVAIAWLLAGCAIAWLIGGAARRDDPSGFDSTADS
jgi:hypothetical protein